MDTRNAFVGQRNREISPKVLIAVLLMLLAALLLCGNLQAQTYYIFTYTDGGTTYFLARDGSTGVQRVSTFDVSTCVWTASETLPTATRNGSDGLTGASGDFIALTQTDGDNTYYLWGAGNNEALKLNNGAPSNYYYFGLVRVNNSSPYHLRSRYAGNSGATRPIYWNGSSWINQDKSVTTDPAASLTAIRVNAPTAAGNSLTLSLTADDVVYTSSTSVTTDGVLGTYSVGYVKYYSENTYWLDGATTTTNTSPSGGSTYTSSNNSSPAVGYTWTIISDNASLFSVTGNNTKSATVTANATLTADQDVTVKLTATIGGSEVASSTATVHFRTATPVAPTLTREECGNTVTFTGPVGSTLRYTTDGTTPTASVGTAVASNSGTYELAASNVTLKVVAIRGDNASSVSSLTASARCEQPTINRAGTDTYTITVPDGTTVKYTTDGSDPASGTTYAGGTVTLSNGSTLRAVATKAGLDNSCEARATYITTGVSGTVATLNDLEEHSWSYYSDPTIPVRSLNPCDVKISYYGNGTKTVSITNAVNPAADSWTANATGVQVGADATVNQFDYFETLERIDGNNESYTSVSQATGRCLYRTIPNPFSKRPVYNTGNTRWRGFYKWRIRAIRNGKIYTAATGGTEKTAYVSGDYNEANCLDAETNYWFAPDGEYGMEVELEALWARAYVSTDNSTALTTFTDSYERNFHVMSGNANIGTFNGFGYPLTVMSSYNPDGSAATTRTLTVNTGTNLAHDLKIEYTNVGASTSSLNANGYYLCVGRGVNTNNALTSDLYGTNGTNKDHRNTKIRVESGLITAVHILTGTLDNRFHAYITFGCDYDRANGDNSKLLVAPSNPIFFGNGGVISNNNNRQAETSHWVVKSGTFQSGYHASTDGAYNHSFYIGTTGEDNSYVGKRYLLVEGGVFACIAGGRGPKSSSATDANPWSTETYVDRNDTTVTIRIKHGTIHGGVYGGAASSPGFGHRKIIITGNSTTSFPTVIDGWVVGGCNGDNASYNGRTIGNSYIYVGGQAIVGGSNAKRIPDNDNGTWGGSIFGAGRGSYSTQTASMEKSFIVVADECDLLHDVYGGGNFGRIFEGDGNKSDIYILGGTVHGRVFGGANQANGQMVNIYMRNGTVLGGVYGGSNASGTVTGPINVQVTGGTVGESGQTEDNGNVFGCGYGIGTTVSGNVVVVIGDSTARTPHVDNPIIWGYVFGGGHEANYTSTGKTFKVLGYNGLVKQSVFGGGKGVLGQTKGKITGDTYVWLKGSIHVEGSVYGGGLAGEVDGSTSVKLSD